MLTDLSICNIVLVDNLNLHLQAGLTTLTGETGAGKSILLDAIGLVMGGRGDSTLIRHGTDKASVHASFDPPSTHPVWQVLHDLDMQYDKAEPLLLHRTIGTDGKSRAFVNGVPTTVRVLKTIGETLIHVQGQFEQHGLLSPKTHLDILDAYAGVLCERAKVQALYSDWQSALHTYNTAVQDMQTAQADMDYIAHCLSELDAVSPVLGEYDRLHIRQTELKNVNRLLGDYNTVHNLIEGEQAIGDLLSRTERSLERLLPLAGDKIQPLIGAVISAHESLTDVAHTVADYASDIQHSAMDLESIEDRLHALHSLAQKHRTTPDGLVHLHAQLAEKHAWISNSDTVLDQHLHTLKQAYTAYIACAAAVSKTRTKSAADLSQKVCAELPNLALKGAVFSVQVDTVDISANPTAWFDIHKVSPTGCDTVVFTARTNAGGVFHAIHKSASGGELSRLLLAVNVALSHTNTATTLIFDEVDTGVGGSAADKIGTRLQALSKTQQVLVITHSPQVASAGDSHYFVEKTAVQGTTVSHITALDTPHRIREIARMLSGDKITEHAVNNAKSLLRV